MDNIPEYNNIQPEETPSPKKKFGCSLKGILIALVMYTISTLLGKLVSYALFSGNNITIRDVEKYADKLSAYEQGILDGNHYYSEYFGFSFDAPADWEIVGNSEVNDQITDDMSSAILDSMLAEHRNEGIDSEVIDKIRETTVIEGEYMATNTDDYSSIICLAFGTYGCESMDNDDKFFNQLKEEMSTQGVLNPKIGIATVLGEETKYAQFTQIAEGVSVDMRIYVIYEKDMACIIYAMTLTEVGFDNIDSFMSGLKKN